MTAVLVSALVNAAILSLGTTGFLWLLLRVVPRSAINAATRYGLWWVALLAAIILPLAFLPALHLRIPRPALLGSLAIGDISSESGQALQHVANQFPEVQASSASATSRTNAADRSVSLQGPSFWNAFRAFTNMLPLKVRAGFWLNLALAAWLLATLTLIGRLVLSYLTLRHRCSDATNEDTKSWPSLESIGNRRLRVAISRDIDTPLAFGFHKPSILLPSSFLKEFGEADIERICVHEAAHLHRRDDITLLVQRFIEAMVPWHPAVLWISRQLDFEREAACDEWAVQATGHYKDYALCLTRVAERGGSRAAMLTTPTVIGTRSDLSRRVDLLLAQRDRPRAKLFKFRFVALTLLFTGVVLAGGRARETVAFREPPQSRDAQVQSIIDDIPAAPPELGADILLKLVERGEITDPKLKRQLIDEAWDLAAKARYATEFGSTMSFIVESEPGSLSSSLPGLTTAALQSRVISQMARIDVGLTRELFQKMKPPEPVSISCTASQFPLHSSYFRALGTTLETFSEEEVQRGMKTQFLKNALRVLTNQEDFRLSLEMIRDSKFKFPDKDYSELLAQWSEMLSAAHFSDRQFSIVSWLFKETLREAGGERAKGNSAENLLRALRSYFVRHAGAVRCEDGSWRPSSPGPGLPLTSNEENARLSFNSTIAELGLNIPPIQPEEIEPKGVAGKAIVVNYLTVDPTDKVWELMNAGKHLRFGTPEQQAINEKNRGPGNVAPTLTPEQRSTPEWSAEALQYLTQLETWTRGLGQEDRGVFIMKAEFYRGLLELSPEGKLHDTVLKSYINFVVSSPLRRESPPEWAWWGFDGLINSSIVSDKRKWLDEIESAGDQTISLYTRLARLALDRTPATAR